MITATKLIELHHSAVPMPPMEIATAASDGPMILPRFHCAFDSPTAATRCSRGTRSGSVDWNDGNVKAPMQPATKLSAAMPSGVAVPPPTHTARIAATIADSALPMARIRRRLHRSAIAEPIGPRIPFGQEPGGADQCGPRRLPGRVGDVVAQPHRFHPRADVREQRPDPHRREVARSEGSEGRGGHARPTLPVTCAAARRSRAKACLRVGLAESGRACRQSWQIQSPTTARCRSSPCPPRSVSGAHACAWPIATPPGRRRCSSRPRCSTSPLVVVGQSIDRWWGWVIAWVGLTICMMRIDAVHHEADPPQPLRPTRCTNDLIGCISGAVEGFHAPTYRCFHLSHHALTRRDDDARRPRGLLRRDARPARTRSVRCASGHAARWSSASWSVACRSPRSSLVSAISTLLADRPPTSARHHSNAMCAVGVWCRSFCGRRCIAAARRHRPHRRAGLLVVRADDPVPLAARTRSSPCPSTTPRRTTIRW